MAPTTQSTDQAPQRTFHLEAYHANGELHGRGELSLHPDASAADAVNWSPRVYEWARGYTDFQSHIGWPFNPMMLVDGRRAADIMAEQFGGNWIAAAATLPAVQSIAA